MTSDAAFDAAIGRAAELLRASAFPVFAGLDTDVAGAAAAIRLAEKLGGAVDHAGAEPSLRDAAVLHDLGLMLVSPGEARQRADTLLLVGDGPLKAWPSLLDFLLGGNRPQGSEATRARRVLELSSRKPSAEPGVETGWFQSDGRSLPGLLGAIRARVNGRPLAGSFASADADAIAERLKAAGYGVAIWSPAEIDALTIEMLAGLIKDLNAETRWSGISVADDATAAGAAMAAGWMTGLPLRTGFGRGFAEHDPWRFEARRLVGSGEADAAVWVSAFANPLPRWLGEAPAIILGRAPAPRLHEGSVALAVGRPGVDHDAILYERRTGTLVQVTASAPSDVPSAAEVLSRIGERLP